MGAKDDEGKYMTVKDGIKLHEDVAFIKAKLENLEKLMKQIVGSVNRIIVLDNEIRNLRIDLNKMREDFQSHDKRIADIEQRLGDEKEKVGFLKGMLKMFIQSFGWIIAFILLYLKLKGG